MWIPERVDENPFVDHGVERDFYHSGVSNWMEPGDYKRRIGFYMDESVKFADEDPDGLVL